MQIREQCEEILSALQQVEERMADPEILGDQKKYRETAQKHSELGRIAAKWNQYKEAESAAADARSLLDDADPEMAEMARAELEEAEIKMPELEQELLLLLLPTDPLDAKNIVMEIRAGTGGDEAALFAGDLLRMYTRYAEKMGWKQELLESNPTELGGFKEIIYSIIGQNVYSHLKYESGIHRVQRVPETEASGRIHTSAITVAVLPEADEVDVEIKAEDIRIDVFRSSGPGGQSVNTTDSAVRITHLPTELVVSCQDEKSQHKNKAKAMRVLRSRLLDLEVQKRQDEQAEARRSQVGTGDRSGRIRTYNFPQNRLSDHRINLTLYQLDAVMQGDFDPVYEALREAEQKERLENAGLV